MSVLMLKDLPRFECLLKAREKYPSLDPTAGEVFLHLVRTGHDVFAAEGAFLAQHQISQGRFTVLMLLRRSDDHPDLQNTPASLAEGSGVTRATMTGLIDTLEKDGLAVREPDPADRRTIRVRLTNKGRKLLDGILPDYFRHVSSLIAPLSENERKQFVRLLRKIQQALPSGAACDTPAAA
jgi:DNA-binding MarR family transcriptional regulator